MAVKPALAAGRTSAVAYAIDAEHLPPAYEFVDRSDEIGAGWRWMDHLFIVADFGLTQYFPPASQVQSAESQHKTTLAFVATQEISIRKALSVVILSFGRRFGKQVPGKRL
jgi:hypothetical protein